MAQDVAFEQTGPQEPVNSKDNVDNLGQKTTPNPAIDFEDNRTTLERLAYTVSLNYNKLATSVLYPWTRWHWYDPIRNTPCILGAVPSRHNLVTLSSSEYNVRHVINMCAEFSGHLDTMEQLGLKQCWIPTKDFHTPSIDALWQGVKYIEAVAAEAVGASTASRATAPVTETEASLGSVATIAAVGTVETEMEVDASSSKSIDGEDEARPVKIYLHCKAGRGRSASVAICWLVYDFDLTLAQAQVLLLSCRGQVDRHLYRLPEIVTFYEQVQALVLKGELKRKTWTD